jgi:hypothetical protein
LDNCQAIFDQKQNSFLQAKNVAKNKAGFEPTTK